MLILVAKVGESRELLKLFLLHFISVYTSFVSIEGLIRLNSFKLNQDGVKMCLKDSEAESVFAKDMLFKCNCLNVSL